MPEQTRMRPPDEAMALFPGGPGDGSDVWGPPDDATGLAVVGSGIYSESLPVNGMSVEAIRQQFADRLDIDPSATAVLDGNAVEDEQTTVHTGQALIFVRWAGEKGTHRVPPGARRACHPGLRR